MADPTKRNGFTALDLMTMIGAAAALMGVFIPATSQCREQQRRETCESKLHQIGTAVLARDDSFKRFPALSTEPYPQSLGESASPVTGFSWIVQILPYMGQRESTYYFGITMKSKKLARGSSAFRNEVIDQKGRHFATVPLDSFVCPNFLGSPISRLSGQRPYENVQGVDLTAKPPVGIAISTYVALPATDIALMKAVNADQNDANGIIVPNNKGMKIHKIADGASRTLLLCETREERLNSWLDGGVNWVVGANPNNAAAPKLDEKNFLVMERGATTALNVGPTTNNPDVRYLTKAGSPNGYEWTWGPSSQHPGGVIMHLYADGAVHPIKDNIDPTVYIRLITRAGGELGIEAPIDRN